MKRNYLLAVVLLLIAMLSPISAMAQTQKLWTDVADTEWYDASKTEFYIYNAKQLAGIAVLVNREIDPITFAGCTFHLKQDIDLGGRQWVPIGNDLGKRLFLGSLSGNGKIIYGLTMNGNHPKQTTELYALIGFGRNFTIEGITLKNVDIKGKLGGSRLAVACGFVGYANGNVTIRNCHVENGIIIGGEGKNKGAGGIVGVSDANLTLIQCSNSATIKAGNNVIDTNLGTNTGGLVGNTIVGGCRIESCYNRGDVFGGNSQLQSFTGGIIGYTRGASISNCYNTGIIHGADYVTEKDINSVGGIVGGVDGTSITDCFSGGKVIAGKAGSFIYTGGIAGYIDSRSSIIGSLAIQSFIESSQDVLRASTLSSADEKQEIVEILVPQSQNRLQNAMPSKKVSETEEAAPMTLRAVVGFSMHRIAGYSKGSTLSNNYAYVPGDWDQDKIGADKQNGADWTGSMDDDPIKTWSKQVWDIDPTHYYLPKLKALDAKFLVVNPLIRLLKFDSNGGSSVPSQYIPLNSTARKPNSPTLKNHRLDYWKTKEGVRWNFDSDRVPGNMTLYAHWVRIYNVTIDPQNGDDSRQVVIDEGNRVTEPKEPTRLGYQFQGWYVEAKRWNFNDPVNSDLQIVAKWTPTLSSDAATFDMIATQVANGKPLTPKVTVRWFDNILTEGTDYTIAYFDNIHPGTGHARITGKGNYTGKLDAYFVIIDPLVVFSLDINEVEGITTNPAAGLSWLQKGLHRDLEIIADPLYSLANAQVYLNDQLIYPNDEAGYPFTRVIDGLTISLGAITENTVIRIEGIALKTPEELLTGMDALASDFRVTPLAGAVRIDARAASCAMIYHTNGILEAIRPIAEGTTMISLPAGIYLIRMGDRTWKVVIGE
ncbi:InlB B-repeat-containing protein [Parabacteroides sp. OttesenSCG-928-N08]|nr:InlB B-repeat-containing protein [Parabacteroides sp. OttesenSCG-928-N08]